MNSILPRPAPRETAACRGRVVLATLALGSLLSTLLAAFGPGSFDDSGLRWTFLLAGPFLSVLFLLAGAYEVADQGAPPPPAYVLTLAGGLVVIYALGLAMPTLIYQRLSPATARLVELSRRPAEELNRRAMTIPDSRQRLEAALGLYLRTGRPAMFMDLSGSPAIFRPDDEEAARLSLPRWLAARPGALDRERRAMALADAVMIVGILVGLPLAIRRAASRAGPPGRPAAGQGRNS